MIKAIRFEAHGSRVELGGVINPEEVMQAYATVTGHPDFADFRYSVWQFDAVESFNLTSQEIRSMAIQDRKLSERNSSLKVAIITDSQLIYGFARMYSLYYGDGPWQVMVSNDADAVETWINE